MDSEILLSVIVPAYNVAEFLPRCLDSILAQTYRNLEILVIDDGSTDETPLIADRYAETDARVIVIHQQNRGLAEARERGIKEAGGAFVGFVDGDDEIIPDMYEKLLQNAIKYDAQISQCGILYCFYDGRRKPVHGSGKLKIYDRIEGCSALLQGSEMEPSLCNKLYRAELLKDSCLDRTVTNNEDMLRNIVLFDRASRSVMEDFCGYLYWRRNESMSNSRKAVSIGENILRARKLILDYVPEELKREAQNNYSLGAINTYNSLIGVRSEEAAALRKDCRGILKAGGALSAEKPGSMKAKAFAILHFPHVYEKVQKAHVRRRKRKIRKQAAQARQASAPEEGQQ